MSIATLNKLMEDTDVFFNTKKERDAYETSKIGTTKFTLGGDYNSFKAFVIYHFGSTFASREIVNILMKKNSYRRSVEVYVNKMIRFAISDGLLIRVTPGFFMKLI